MLCVVQRNSSSKITGVSPAAVSWPRCTPPCCVLSVQLQIRTRYRNGTAKLCASIPDPEEPGSFVTESSTVIVYHKFVNGVPSGTCTYTKNVKTGSSAIVSGSTTFPDCGGEPDDESDEPDDCVSHMNDPPTTSVTADEPEITYSGDRATKDDVRSAALAAMTDADWSDWVDIAEINPATGSAEGANLSYYLAESGRGDNGLSGGGFIAVGWQYESQLQIIGNVPISIAVSEGEDITTADVNRYVLETGTPKGFSVGGPSFASGWVSDKAVLRCACPVHFADS